MYRYIYIYLSDHHIYRRTTKLCDLVVRRTTGKKKLISIPDMLVYVLVYLHTWRNLF